MTVLVTGGAGYIGSHTVVDLLDKGFEVIIVDNYSNSEPSVLEGIKTISNKNFVHYDIDLCDEKKLKHVFDQHDIQSIIHFAAFKSVEESTVKPLSYFRNNLVGLINLLSYCQKKPMSFIFSSSCSVYGNTEDLPVLETTSFGKAECPYARTKQMAEAMIGDFALANPHFKSIILRYFNPAGAHESALIGESSRNKATNLVPVITETGIGKRSSMTVFGTDYETRDGSCVRDYIHVMDLAEAHTKSLQFSKDPKFEAQIEIINLGIGKGVTVLEAIHAFEKESGIQLNYNLGPRRSGDVVSIYADNTKAFQKLSWRPKRDISDIMKSAWAWEQKRSKLLDDL